MINRRKMETLIRLNKIYGKFYDRNEGIKIYRSNFGRKFSDAAFKRATDAIDYKSAVFLRYSNLLTAQKLYMRDLTEQEKEKLARANIRRIELIFLAALLPIFIMLIGYLLLVNY